jgi:hypothetical protein
VNVEMNRQEIEVAEVALVEVAVELEEVQEVVVLVDQYYSVAN